MAGVATITTSLFGLHLLLLFLLSLPAGQTNTISQEEIHRIQKRCVPDVATAIAHCCRHGMMSPEYMNCCEVHQCCPLCESPILKHCCFEGENYPVGTVVAQFPEICTELVCTNIKTLPPKAVIQHQKMSPCDNPCDPNSNGGDTTPGPCVCKMGIPFTEVIYPCDTVIGPAEEPCTSYVCVKPGIIVVAVDEQQNCTSTLAPPPCVCEYGQPPVSYPCGSDIGPGPRPCTTLACTEDGRISVNPIEPPCPPLPTQIPCASYTTEVNTTTCCPYIACTGSIGGNQALGVQLSPNH